jgi:hypothetical protein
MQEEANMNFTPAASHSRFALLDPWEAHRAEEKEAGRCAREVQRQPAGQDAGYGCVEWYFYSQCEQTRDEPRAR